LAEGTKGDEAMTLLLISLCLGMFLIGLMLHERTHSAFNRGFQVQRSETRVRALPPAPPLHDEVRP
jgi:hypothetical protein